MTAEYAMLPGAGDMKDALSQVDDSQLDRIQAIMLLSPASRGVVARQPST